MKQLVDIDLKKDCANTTYDDPYDDPYNWYSISVKVLEDLTLRIAVNKVTGHIRIRNPEIIPVEAFLTQCWSDIEEIEVEIFKDPYL